MMNRGREAELLYKDHSGRSLAHPNRPVYQGRAPWIEPPTGYQAFFLPGIIDTPAADDADHAVLSLVVPPGWDGVINKLAHTYIGPGFLAGSGDLTWRILQAGQAVRNFDAIQVAYGTWSGGGAVVPFAFEGIPVSSGQELKYLVNHSAASALAVAGTKIIVYFGGYFYPRQA